MVLKDSVEASTQHAFRLPQSPAEGLELPHEHDFVSDHEPLATCVPIRVVQREHRHAEVCVALGDEGAVLDVVLVDRLVCVALRVRIGGKEVAGESAPRDVARRSDP